METLFSPDNWAGLGIDIVLGIVLFTGIVLGIKPLMVIFKTMIDALINESKQTRQSIENMTTMFQKNITTEERTAAELLKLTGAINAVVTQNQTIQASVKGISDNVLSTTEEQLSGFFDRWEPIMDTWRGVAVLLPGLQTTLEKINNTMQHEIGTAAKALEQGKENNRVLNELVELIKSQKVNTERLTKLENEFNLMKDEKKKETNDGEQTEANPAAHSAD